MRREAPSWNARSSPGRSRHKFLRNEPNEKAKVIVTKGYGRELRAIQSHLSSNLEARERREQPPSAGAPSPSATRYLRNEPTAKPYEESREPEQGGTRATRRTRRRLDPTPAIEPKAQRHRRRARAVGERWLMVIGRATG